jgi:hypothetical protein
MNRIDRRNLLKAMGTIPGKPAFPHTVAGDARPDKQGMEKDADIKVPDALKAEY